MTNRPNIAIIGGGTIGIYLAARLSTSAQVTVFEADLGEERAAEVLLGANRSLGTHDGSRTGWASALGGTSTLWGGQLLPWEPWEFEQTDGAVWPLGFSEIEPHYSRVLEVLGVSAVHDRVHRNMCSIGNSPTSDTFHVRRSTWLSRRERNFRLNPELRRRLREAQLRVGHRVTRVRSVAGAYAVTAVSGGREYSTQFDHVILTAGTFGNVRLLQEFFDGDRADIIGSGFMDHVSGRVAAYRVIDWNKFRQEASQRIVEGVRTSIKYVSRPAYVAERSLSPGYAHWELDIQNSALMGLRRGQVTPANLRQSFREVRDVVDSIAWSTRTASRPLPSFARPYLRVDVEQLPSPSRRLRWRLSTGGGHLEIDWGTSQKELDSVRTLGAAAVRMLEGRDIGAAPDEVFDEPELVDTKHLMGGTVMGLSSASSVVDADGRVHDQSGLWVAGASTFPSGGVANPTFTALALADRMADVLGA